MLNQLNSIMLINLLNIDAIFITNWGKYYKVGQLYGKVGQFAGEQPGFAAGWREQGSIQQNKGINLYH